MTEGGRAAWFEIAVLAADGVLKAPHRIMLEVLCELLAEWREDPRKFMSSKMGHLIGCCARMGLSPSDQQKLGIDRAEAPDPMDEFVR
jgi:hypothetical protein